MGPPLHAQITLTWNSGDILTLLNPATIVAGDTLAIATTADHDFNSRTLINNGTVNWQAGRIRSGTSGSVTNNATWNDLGTSTLGATTTGSNAYKNDFGGSFIFTNDTNGTYTKSGTGTTIFQDAIFNNSGSVVVSNGTLVLNGGGSSSGSFSAASGATIRLSNNYTITDGSNLTGAGVFESTGGTSTIAGSVNATNYRLAGATLAGTQTFTGGVTWTTGNMSTTGTTTNASGSTFTINGTNDHDFNTRSLVNNGTVNWNAGRIRSGTGGSIINSSQWNDLGTSTLGATSTGSSAFKNDFGGSYTFTNDANGIYTKSGSGTTIFQDAVFNNSGSVLVQAGTLRLNGGGSSSSSFQVSSGASLDFTNNYAITDGSNLSGAGSYALTGGTLTIDGNVSLASFLLNGGALAGTHSFSGSVTWNATNLSNSGSTTIASGATLVIATTADHDFKTRALVNQGTVNWNAGRIRSGTSGSITNSSQWNDLGTSTLGATTTGSSAFKNDFGGSYTFTNDTNGTYTKSGSGTTVFQDAAFNNSGSVVVSNGTLVLNGGGSSSGAFSAASGTSIRLSNNYTITDGSNLTGAGIFVSTGGTSTIAGSVNVTNYQLAGATLAGTQSFTGGVTWTTGNMSTTGTTTNASGSTFTINGTNDHDFNTRALVNQGTVDWNAGRLRSGTGGSITNNATWNDLGTSTLGATTTGSSAFKNDFGGSFTFTNAAGATYTKSGTGTTHFQDPTVINHGTFAISAGTLDFSNGITLSATSNFLFTLSGHTSGTEYGLVSISGILALQGSLNLKFGSGFDQIVASNDTFNLLTASAFNGGFSNIANGARLLTSDGLGSFQVNYGSGSAFAANSLVLSNFTPVPEPSTWALLILGGCSLVLRGRRRS